MAIHGTVRGTQFGKIDQPQDSFSENSVGEQVITRTYRTLWASWLQEAPARGSAHPVYVLAKLEKKDAKQITPGFLCDVTLSYRAPREDVTPEPGDQLPAPRYSEVVTEGTASIEEHPSFPAFGTVENGALFNADNKFLGWAADSPFAGRDNYETGSVTRSTTTYFWSQPDSVATLLNNVSGNWRVSSGSVQTEGIYWSRTINEKYNPNGWPSPIYGA